MEKQDTDIKVNDKIWKINIDKRLHSLMRELAQRKRSSTGLTIADQYETAIDNYLQIERIPKQVEKIERTSIRFKVTEEFLSKVNSLRAIALKKRQSLPVVLEELLTMFLEKPENYLGKNFYERFKRKLEVIK